MRAPSGRPPERVVCHLVERLGYGGAETLVHRLATRMGGTGYTPIVCCLQDGPLVRQLERDGVPVECLNLQRRSVLQGPRFVGFTVNVLRGITRIVELYRVDLIHAHVPDSIMWAAAAGAMSRTPVVGTYHGLGLLPSGRTRIDPRNAIRRVLYRLTARMSDRTIAVSAPVRDLLCGEIGFDATKTVVMLNGVDTAAFASVADNGTARAALGLDNRRIVTCVGRLIAGKGQRFLIEAMAAVVRRHPDSALLLVGDGPETRPLLDLVDELGLREHVRLAGPRSDVPDLLAMTEIFVLPSFAEGIPLAVLEAMAAAKPVIATAVPGNRDVIVDERFGVLVPPRDAAALAEAICRLLDDPVGARAIGNRAQARVREHFDIGRLVSSTTALYAQVLAERGSNTPKGAAR